MSSESHLSRAGFILAGGKSSRMGVDKAFLEFEGRTLLGRAIAVLSEACNEVAIVGDRAKFASRGTVVSDLYPGCGPLAGIHAALTHSSADLNLVMAVDMPSVSPELVQFLFATAAECDAVVVLPRTATGSQPLCAVYRRAFAATSEAALKAGKYKIDALFAGIAVRTVEEGELASAGFSESMFFNVNTPDDLRSSKR
jgi:molybdopterin-guanine dinucleotide biosynthesis protein A